MSNAVENALARMDDEQRAQALQVIEEARANIRLVSMQSNEMTPSAADAISKNAQIIEEAKRTIPAGTMQHVDSIGPPMTTPPTAGYFNSTVVELHPTVKSSIEEIERGGGNNYLQENAVDRAMNRPSQDMQRGQEPEQSMER